MLAIETGPQIPPVPSDLVANGTAAWAFTWFTLISFALVAIWALHAGFRKRNWLPLALLAGGTMCGFLEPGADVFGLTYYPANTPLLVFEGFDRQIPVFVFLGEGMFFATAVYGAYRLLLAGTPVKRLLWFMALFSLFDAVMEMFLIHFGVMTYYGNNPSRILGLPLYAIVQNGALALVLGWVVLALAPQLRGWRHPAWILIVPSAFAAQAIAATWPMYGGLNSAFPTPVMWALTVLVTATNLALPLYVIHTPIARAYRPSIPGTTQTVGTGDVRAPVPAP